jgi:hypothetical protein
VTGRRGRRGKQLLDDVNETRGYWKLKEEALDHSGSEIDNEPTVRQTMEWIKS